MEAFPWLSTHWFDSVQIVGIVGGLLFTAYTVRKDERARQVGNMLAINAQHDFIWSKLYEKPQLARVLKQDVDLHKQPVSDEEWVFVKMLLLHLDTVRRASRAKMFVKIQGLQSDVQFFLSLPIPRAVWEKLKPFQDEEFVSFVEDCLRASSEGRKNYPA